MRKSRFLIFNLLTILFVSVFISCKTEVESVVDDKTAPGEIAVVVDSAINGTIRLSWSNPSDKDFEGVKISCEPAAGSLENPIMVGKNVNNYSIMGLKNGTKYAFKLQTFDDKFNYSSGKIIEGTPKDNRDKTAPEEIEIGESIVGDSRVVLNWTNPANEDFAGIELSATPATGSLAHPIILGKNATSFEVGGLKNSTEYTFNIRTFDNCNNYSSGKEIKITPVDSSDKTAPAEIQPKIESSSNGIVILSWSNPSDKDFEGVKISCIPAAGSLKNPVMLDKTVNKYTVTGLENGNNYSFKIQTFDNCLNYSNGATITSTPKDNRDKTAPEEIEIGKSIIGDSRVVLNWINPANEDFAGIELSATPATGSLAHPIILGKNATSFEVGGLKNSTEYTFNIRTFDNCNNYSSGKEIKITPISSFDTVKPGVVSNINLKDINGAVNITWNDPIDKDLYGIKITYNEVLKSRAYSSMKPNDIIVAPGTQSVVIPNLKEKTTYTFYLTAIDLYGNNGESINTTITLREIDKIPAGELRDFAATYDPKTCKVKLTWKNPPDSDYNKVIISHENTVIEMQKNQNSCEFVIKGDDKIHTFISNTFDETGNKGASLSYQIKLIKDLTGFIRLKDGTYVHYTQITDEQKRNKESVVVTRHPDGSVVCLNLNEDADIKFHDNVNEYGISTYPVSVYLKRCGSGWYLPNDDMLLIIYKHRYIINQALLSINETTLSDNWYWGSTTNRLGEHVRRNPYTGYMEYADGNYMKAHARSVKVYK